MQTPISSFLPTKPCLGIYRFCLPFQEQNHTVYMQLVFHYSLSAFQTLFSPIPHFQASPEFLTHCFNLEPAHGQVIMRKASCNPLHMFSGHYYSYGQHAISRKRFSGLLLEFNYHTAVTLYRLSELSVPAGQS